VKAAAFHKGLVSGHEPEFEIFDEIEGIGHVVEKPRNLSRTEFFNPLPLNVLGWLVALVHEIIASTLENDW
jgi:hypothetical protein